MWRDLSDGELRARLRQRGVDDESVDVMIEHRDEPADDPVVQVIEDLL